MLRERGEHANKIEVNTGLVLKQVSLSAVAKDVLRPVYVAAHLKNLPIAA